MTSIIRPGFEYTLNVRSKRTGEVLAREHAFNRVPIEGLNDIAETYLKGGTAPAALYVGAWTGSHVPDGNETAASLLGIVTEVTNYVQAGRLVLMLGSVTGGACSNQASLARFDMLGAAVVNGMFLSTTQAKGSSAGKLASVVRFANPRTVDETVYLEVLTGFQFISL